MSRRAALALLGALTACTAMPDRPPADDDPRAALWPPPPDLPRFAFETALRSPADIYVDTDAARARRLMAGETLSADSAFDKPNAVAARNGRIYVTDTVRRHVVAFDVPRRTVYAFGLRPPGTLVKPIALALDREQRVYVADATLRKVIVYDGLGLHQRTIGGPDELERPTGVAVSQDGERVYVIDRASNDSDRHRVIAHDRAGRRVAEIGRRGRGEGEFNIPVQGAVGPDGTLYVLDAGNFRVQAFDRDGRFLRAFGSLGTGLGQLARPRGLAVDDEGNAYVADATFGNVQVFDPAGRLLITLGALGKRDRPGRYGLPFGVAVDETGRVYVVDQLFNKVEVLKRLTRAEGEGLQRDFALR